MAEAISKGTDAINKLVLSGEIEELKEVISQQEIVDEDEEYLNDDGDIDFSKIPDVELPPPLPSSKFAQNPELLKSLNRGGKRRFDQLIGWSDGGASDRTSKVHQPVFGASVNEDSQSSDTYMRDGYNDEEDDEEDYRRYMDDDDDYRFGSGRSEFDLRNNFADKDFRSGMNRHFSDDRDRDSFGDRDRDSFENRDRDGNRDGRPRWETEKEISDGNRKMEFGNMFDKPPNLSNMPPHMGNMPNHHNMQNINPNMPPPMPNMGSHSNMPPHSNKNMGMDGPMPPHMMHPPPPFGPNGPPPPFGPNFRPPNGPNFGPNFRPMGPFGNQGPPFNNFGPPNFRGPGPNSGPPNFERPGFGPNFRGPNPGCPPPRPGGPNFNPGFGNFGPNKTGPNVGMSRGPNDNGMGIRNSFSGRGRGGDSSRGRGRDNY